MMATITRMDGIGNYSGDLNLLELGAPILISRDDGELFKSSPVRSIEEIQPNHDSGNAKEFQVKTKNSKYHIAIHASTANRNAKALALIGRAYRNATDPVVRLDLVEAMKLLRAK